MPPVDRAADELQAAPPNVRGVAIRHAGSAGGARLHGDRGDRR
jgi:hypothetical protein